MLYSVAPRAGVRARGVLPAAIRGGGAARPNSHAPRETELSFNPKGLPHPLRSGLRFGSSRRDVSSRVIFGPGTQVKEEEAGDKDDAATEEEPARRRLPFLRGAKTRNESSDAADAPSSEAETTPRTGVLGSIPTPRTGVLGSILSTRVNPDTGEAETFSVPAGLNSDRGPVQLDELRSSARDARDAVRDGLTGAAER